MSDGQHGGTTPEDEARRTKADRENGALAVLGLVFFVLGIGGVARGEQAMTAFLGVGVVFFVLGSSRAARTRTQDGSTGGRERAAGGDGSAAGADGDSRTDSGDASGSDAGGGGDGGGGGD